MKDKEYFELDNLFEEIRKMILRQDEKSHNWNKNAIAGKVVNKWLIFKKERGIITGHYNKLR